MATTDTFPIADRSSNSDLDYRRYVDGRLQSLRNVRWSWFTHWRELADYFLPRRYKWFITPNQWNRGSPINGHIIDSTGVLAARNLASGLLSGKSSPTRKWFKLAIGFEDSTQTSPASLWLAECERILRKIFQESNFYSAIAQYYHDLVVFGTASIIIYEDFENVINCFNPALGEFYVDIDGQYRPCILYREFTMSIGALVDRFGEDNCSLSVRNAYNEPNGAGRSREIIVAHSIEPNDRKFNIVDDRFAYREVYWELGGSQSPQAGATSIDGPTFLSIRGFHEQPQATSRWDIVSNDPYGRSPGMDGLGDQKQLQLEQKRKAQAIDKMVNPPLIADIQLKNQPVSLLPGGMTFVAGMAQSGKPGVASIYDQAFPIGEIKEDLEEVRDRLRKIFYNDLFQTASQFETRSNITAVEWDMRKSESMVMLGPVDTRLDTEALAVIIDRVFGIAARAKILPPPPQSIAGKNIDVSFYSMLAQAQEAAQAAGIERTLGMAGNISAVQPAIIDKIDTEYAIDKYSSMLGNDPKLMRSPEAFAQMQQQRQQQMAQAQAAEAIPAAAQSAKVLSETEVGAGKSALQMITGLA